MARKTINLNGDAWEVGKCKPGLPVSAVERWIPAVVPGEVRLDLLRAGMIDDPFYGKNNESSRWVEQSDWWWRRSFTLPSGDYNRIFLRFDGLDYHSHVAVNGRHVSEHVGMFEPVLVEITGIAGRGENSLAVCIEHAAKYADRMSTLKCQMSYGWDFAPSILTMGLWDDATLHTAHTVHIRNTFVDPIFHNGRWAARVRFELDSNAEIDAALNIEIDGENFKRKTPLVHREDLQLRPGVTNHTIDIPIGNPRLWYPWEQGPQNRYRLTASLRAGLHTLDRSEALFGLRHIELKPNEGANSGHDWTFTINGRRIFIRGANWVPADSFPGRINAERYESLLTAAKDAGINMLRVWGGGLREKRAFYDLCDSLGILVWQEYPFACPTKAYSRSVEFMGLAEQEARAITRFIRNHPSVVMLCGGNEFSYTRNKPLVHLLERIAREDGGGRLFKRTSPTDGEDHNWLVHHALMNHNTHKKDKGAFLSEFGYQAPPCRESLEKFIPEINLWEVGPTAQHIVSEFAPVRNELLESATKLIPSTRAQRNSAIWAHHSAQLLKIFRHAKVVGFNDLDSFIDAAQRMQAHIIQTAAEHVRRRRYESSGVIFWQFNDPWPNISWSVVDYYEAPKLAYYKIREVYSPVLISLDYPLEKYATGSRFRATPHIINDLHVPAGAGKLTLRMTDDGRPVGEELVIETPETPPDSQTILAPVELVVPEAKRLILECLLEGPEGPQSRNTYDLSIHDPYPGPLLVKAVHDTVTKFAWR